LVKPVTQVRLAIDAYKRTRAGEPEIILKNGFFERNPINLVEQVAIIRRPAHRHRTVVGDGPIRRMSYQAGKFDDDAFVVSGTELYRVHRTTGGGSVTLPDTPTHIAGTVDDSTKVAPDISFRADAVFISDGVALQYTDGAAALAAVALPDSVAPSSIDYINGFIIIVISGTQRCYWINPGEFTVDSLNFFEAERSPDNLLQVRTVGDNFWLLGQTTTEVWRMTGDAAAPFQRIEGRLFDNGVWGGTAVRMKTGEVVVVGNDGTVYRIAGAPKVVSNPGISEMIRDAMYADKVA
jgi:hypothetical protein